MRKFQWRLRTLMVLIAVGAISAVILTRFPERRALYLARAGEERQGVALATVRAVQFEAALVRFRAFQERGDPPRMRVFGSTWGEIIDYCSRESRHARGLAAYHGRLVRECERAACYPWLSIAPAPKPPG